MDFQFNPMLTYLIFQFYKMNCPYIPQSMGKVMFSTGCLSFCFRGCTQDFMTSKMEYTSLFKCNFTVVENDMSSWMQPCMCMDYAPLHGC